jgi:5-formyltetrahydrofolate cyclo-ligase
MSVASPAVHYPSSPAKAGAQLGDAHDRISSLANVSLTHQDWPLSGCGATFGTQDMTDKRALRAHLHALRDGFARTGAIATPPAFLARLSPGMTVASYVPIGSEADPGPLADAAARAGCHLALPHVVDRATPIRFLAWQHGAPLVAGPFGLSQPPDSAPACAPDIILTPLVGFDRRGNRLGQGAGHYDRAFAAHPAAWRIGVAWSVQQVDALAPDPWDVPLHAIVTESEWIVP